MNTMTIARELQLPEVTLRTLEAMPLPENHDVLEQLFWQDPAGFVQAVPKDDHGLSILRLYLAWLPQMRERYDRLGIPEDIFRDNLKDLGIWCRDCTDKTGLPGMNAWHWVAHSLRLELFRLGRLQFEPQHLDTDVTVGGIIYPKGTPVLSVHIPAEEPLSPDAVEDAFRRAKAFFPRYFGRSYPLLFCHSWLLSPMLKELLEENSRILQFQDQFFVYAQEEDRQAEERVFGAVQEDPALYPENTALQKALKQFLLTGRKATAGAGIRPL